MGAEVLLRSVRMIEGGTAPRLPQEEGPATPAPRIFRDDCRINWQAPADRVRNFIRGLAPFPGAFTTHGGRLLKIYRTRMLPGSVPLAPGTLRVGGGTLEVGTADCPLAVIELQQETRRRMGAEEFLRGYSMAAGERFE
jgi:methionyl-tRNA formyltransferase